MKPNVLAQKGIAEDFRQYTFTDPRTKTEYPVRLRPLSEMETTAALEFGDRLSTRYVTGGYYDQSNEYREKPETLGLIEMDDGSSKPIEASATMLKKFAILERAQGIKRGVFDDAPRDGVYNAIELAHIVETAFPVWVEIDEAWKKLKFETVQKKYGAAQDGKPNSPQFEPETGI